MFRPVASPQPVILGILCPATCVAWGNPPSRRRSTRPHFSSSAKTPTASPHTLAAAILFVDSPPAEIVSSRCPVELTSSIEAASPARSVPALPAPIPDDSISNGLVPASAAAIDALSAAVPEPTMTNSQDSMVLDSCEPCSRHEDDARDFVPKITSIGKRQCYSSDL